MSLELGEAIRDFRSVVSGAGEEQSKVEKREEER
jgi:hypothetical protein